MLFDVRPRLEPLRKVEWVVYAKRPFAGPAGVRFDSTMTTTLIGVITVGDACY
jgi:hypothetical protein